MTDIISSNDTTEPTYTVTIADTWGDTVVQMTKPEIEATAKANNTWVFIDNQLVNTSAITTSQLDAAEAIRLMPGLLGGSEPTYTVTIADLTGDTVVQMTKPEIEATATANNAREAILDTPGLVGGSEPTYTVFISDLTGETVVQMTKPEIEATAMANNAWVFVNDRLVNSSDIAETNLDASSVIRLMPALVGGL